MPSTLTSGKSRGLVRSSLPKPMRPELLKMIIVAVLVFGLRLSKNTIEAAS